METFFSGSGDGGAFTFMFVLTIHFFVDTFGSCSLTLLAKESSAAWSSSASVLDRVTTRALCCFAKLDFVELVTLARGLAGGRVGCSAGIGRIATGLASA
jgi:hypothetical protein